MGSLMDAATIALLVDQLEKGNYDDREEFVRVASLLPVEALETLSENIQRKLAEVKKDLADAETRYVRAQAEIGAALMNAGAQRISDGDLVQVVDPAHRSQFPERKDREGVG